VEVVLGYTLLKGYGDLGLCMIICYFKGYLKFGLFVVISGLR